jgi:hypothetical protein
MNIGSGPIVYTVEHLIYRKNFSSIRLFFRNVLFAVIAGRYAEVTAETVAEIKHRFPTGQCGGILDYIGGIFLEGVLILQNSSLKLKAVADNANLLNCAVSSENISECIKSKTKNGFHLKVNVYKFR